MCVGPSGGPRGGAVSDERGTPEPQAFNLDKMEKVCLAKLSEIMKKKSEQKRPGPPGPHGGVDFFPEHGSAFVGDEAFGQEVLNTISIFFLEAKARI